MISETNGDGLADGEKEVKVILRYTRKRSIDAAENWHGMEAGIAHAA